MNFRVTERFAKAYRALPDAIRVKVDKSLRLLASDPRHPSLHLKKIQGTDLIWEARVNRRYKFTLELHKGYYPLRNVGKHDDTLGRP